MYPPKWSGARQRPSWGTCPVCNGLQGELCSAFATTHNGHDHRKDSPLACGQGCPCCRHRVGDSVCNDCTPHYKGRCTLGAGNTPCEQCLRNGSTGRHHCRRCGAINAHFTRECQVPSCNLGPSGGPCEACSKKGGGRPHKCNKCGQLNAHRTRSCPRG